ncbi:MAG: hypothetical protein V1903_02860 [Bacteroidota bacterium]
MARFKNIRIFLHSILIFTVLLLFTNMVCFSQTGTTLPDSSKISQKSSETGEMNQNKEQAKTQAQNKNQGNTQKPANANAVKQVKSAKPDMSKAKGARPNVVRPSGSAVPKGAGKPGGIKRMGGR